MSDASSTDAAMTAEAAPAVAVQPAGIPEDDASTTAKRQRREVRAPSLGPAYASGLRRAPGAPAPLLTPDLSRVQMMMVDSGDESERSESDDGGSDGAEDSEDAITSAAHKKKLDAAEAAAGALAEAAAGAVLAGIEPGGEAGGEDAHVARLRGLPWSFTVKEVSEFIATAASATVRPEAVTMMHNASGEAFVSCESAGMLEQLQRANRQQVGKRYVEVFSSSAAEKLAACERNTATMKPDAGYRGVLRMRGLPYTATADEVLTFFGRPASLHLENVHLLRRADGRASGDAYVVFDSEDAASLAMQYDKQKLGSRWGDLFQSTKGELYSLTSSGGIMLPSSEFSRMSAPSACSTSALGDGYSVVKLRGLPWNVTPEDITAFLAPLNVPAGGIHLMNGANGRPSGVAYVELASDGEQAEALAKDKQSIGGRYIDIFSCSQTELQVRL